MTDAPKAPPPAETPGEGPPPTFAARYALYQRAGGIITPLLTALLAFFIGGLVVLLTTGKNPLSTYKAIFDGTGLNWLFPWVRGTERDLAAEDLQQTLLVTTTLILVGIAVAFAFRCGLFNIGGQGQYIAGMITASQVGIWMPDLAHVPHMALAAGAGALAGAIWGGIAGVLKATVGVHEVIATIMLNWIALWIGSYLVGFEGPLQDPAQVFVPVTEEVSQGAKLNVWWGEPVQQGLHIGFFIALAALILFYLVLNRTTLGYEVRAVGFNPEAARYGGISVGRNYFLAMGISGAFAGLAGGVDILGWLFRVDLTSVQISSSIAFMGIAVALLGRNTPLGIFFSALLFAALLNGTSTRNLDPAVFEPELAGNLTLIIQGLVVLFVGADLLILYLWRARTKLRRRRPAAATQ
ncbi:MAG TPA: ABC transporter permease [Gaiellaceae bacterium]|nr:ABC transporter permease [Gaiellaceae bacterium]